MGFKLHLRIYDVINELNRMPFAVKLNTTHDLEGNDFRNSMTNLATPKINLSNTKYPPILHAGVAVLHIWLRSTKGSHKCWMGCLLINSLCCIIAASGCNPLQLIVPSWCNELSGVIAIIHLGFGVLGLFFHKKYIYIYYFCGGEQGDGGPGFWGRW